MIKERYIIIEKIRERQRQCRFILVCIHLQLLRSSLPLLADGLCEGKIKNNLDLCVNIRRFIFKIITQCKSIIPAFNFSLRKHQTY